jgi:ferredoxin-NADP reductase/predicted pyridoxine 5'-phosphate oxidase superfamily flavin-nucleotide-binding protein
MVCRQTPEASGPWHEGELRMQRSVGVVEKMDARGRRVVRNHLIEQHRLFYPQLPFVVLGAVDAAGDVWATVRAGHPGFLRAPDPGHLDLALARDCADPADSGMEDGMGIGLLGIELHTRRRNRINGTIHRERSQSFVINVEQSYGNCPQYIQARDFTFARDPDTSEPVSPTRLDRLDGRAADLVRHADTFFVASYLPCNDGCHRVDVSHRGGRPAFVRLDDDGGLTIPDFAGNLFFNTLGNFLLNPRAGLVFVDFDTGDLLQMTGDAEVILESPEIAAFQGAERLWRFRPHQIINRPGALPLRWRFAGGWSPNSLLTGDWDKAAKRTGAVQQVDRWRIFRIASVVEESSIVRSLILEPTDEFGMVPHRPGQHIPIRVLLPGGSKPLRRTYTLSVAPSDGVYRISVKRDGQVSIFLHGLQVGDTIEVQAPAGNFTIDAGEPRPAVLLAAGIGITPMLAMLRHIVYEGARTRRTRRTWLLYSARSKDDRPFDAELSKLVTAAGGAVRLVRFLSNPVGVSPEDYDQIGRIDTMALASILPSDDFDFFLCGPVGFMQSIYDGLRGAKIADERIYAESFGASGLRRHSDRPTPGTMRLAASQPVSVTFARSGKTATWTPGSGSLLELAETAGLTPEFQCRIGSCGTCRTQLLKGTVAYETQPSADVDDGHALICCAVPAEVANSEVSLEL